jgi:two-component system, OmpR family, response regulator
VCPGNRAFHAGAGGASCVRILVIEDEPDLRSAIAQSLSENGYAVDTANDGEDGLYKATTWPYDAVILDIMLPKMNGWDVLKSIREKNASPVLILTARDAVTDRVRGLDGGADDYLVKPFSIQELLARLRALIRRACGNAESVIRIEDVEINLANRTVIKEGQAIVLTAREFALVEMLALNRGRLISRSQIYDHIFGEDDDTLSNLVDVHVSHIRKKLGADFIITRRGQGYIIDV